MYKETVFDLVSRLRTDAPNPPGPPLTIAGTGEPRAPSPEPRAPQVLLFFALVLTIGCGSVEGIEGDRLVDTTQYVAGELIVKLSPEAGEALEASLSNPDAPLQKDFEWFEELNERFGVTDITPLFSPRFDPEAIKRKFPERARRVPPGTNVPSLKYVYKLTMDSHVDVMEAASQYSSHREVIYAEPNYIASIHTAPTTE